MNINVFLFFVLGLLAGIYIFFKPMDLKQNIPKNMPQLELKNFVIHEYDQQKLKTILSGSEGKRFKTYYDVKDLNFTNNEETYVENMVSDYGKYEGDVITLKSRVHYQKNDGSNFSASYVVYDRNSSLVTTEGAFKLWKGTDRMQGENLIYNSETGIMKAQTIRGIYLIRENI